VDALEQLVGEILWNEGYWVRTLVKVELTKEEKRLIGRHSSPRWELDIVAYNGRENLLRVVECKSYIDSIGVKACCFDGTSPEEAKRYKLFNELSARRGTPVRPRPVSLHGDVHGGTGDPGAGHLNGGLSRDSRGDLEVDPVLI
jgi:hypothetical protein